MTFKVGDWVRVKTLGEMENDNTYQERPKNLEDGLLFFLGSPEHSVGFNSRMSEYCGKIYKVLTIISSNRYELEEVNGWIWSNKMLAKCGEKAEGLGRVFKGEKANAAEF